MANGKFVAYFRVSTKRQGRSGLGLDAQRHAINEYLNGGRWKLVGEFTEVESGKKSDRPELAKAISLCRIHKATLVVAKMDRLARNLHFITSLRESGIAFVACDIPEANKLTVNILASVAEAEAEAISARTKAALQAAKERGVQLGGDRGNLPDVCRKGSKIAAKLRIASARQRAFDVAIHIRDVQENGANTLREIAAALNEREVPAPRGGEWSATQVQRVMALVRRDEFNHRLDGLRTV